MRRSAAPWTQCNLARPRLDKHPPALIQVTLHRRVQRRLPESAADQVEAEKKKKKHKLQLESVSGRLNRSHKNGSLEGKVTLEKWEVFSLV